MSLSVYIKQRAPTSSTLDVICSTLAPQSFARVSALIAAVALHIQLRPPANSH